MVYSILLRNSTKSLSKQGIRRIKEELKLLEDMLTQSKFIAEIKRRHTSLYYVDKTTIKLWAQSGGIIELRIGQLARYPSWQLRYCIFDYLEELSSSLGPGFPTYNWLLTKNKELNNRTPREMLELGDETLTLKVLTLASDSSISEAS